MAHRIEVAFKEGLVDPREDGVLAGIRDLGITGIQHVSVADVYWLDASLLETQLRAAGTMLLSDPVAQVCGYDGEHVRDIAPSLCALEVAYNRGVSDPLEATILKGLKDIGIDDVPRARSAIRYVFHGWCSPEDIDVVTHRLLLNPLVQHVVQPGEDVFPDEPTYQFELRRVPLLHLDDVARSGVASAYGFFPSELDAIHHYFASIGREPTDVELETLAQSWSEHCVHKTFKARITFDGECIDNLLRSTIMQATRALNKEWCLSVFEDNAGVIDFDGEHAICFKVETHNHPSAVEPYGGAATGLGGVVRDVLGTGLGARPIVNTDVFCFAPPDMAYDALPAGVLHPRRVFKGVRAGVADYGNRLGIPTLNGTLRFDPRYIGNPLVFCGTAGIMPRWAAYMGKQHPGDLVVLMGGRTGRDGIHGVTFASEKLDDTSVTRSRSAVQIGNAIVEKRVIDALMQARDKKLYRRITDCGGGGLSSAVGEMGSETGVRVHLDRVPLKYAGLSYDEIWISESQERMVVAVPPENVDELMKVCSVERVEATVIGEFTNDRRLELLYDGVVVGDLDMEFLHDGRPQLDLVATQPHQEWAGRDPAPPESCTAALLAVLSSLNVCSKEWVIRQYDHEVQGGSVLKPLVGPDADGPGDAAIIKPLLESDRGLAIANGINTRYGDIDAYWMAASAIDEALRQVVAVGAGLDRVALLDNFCWGRASEPESLWALVRSCKACQDMSLAFDVPFISGKDSLNNFTETEGHIITIPHTLLISAIAVMPDVNRAITMDLKSAGDLLYAVGNTYAELAGSEYCSSLPDCGRKVPEVRFETARATMLALSNAISDGLVVSCHDMSEGGLAVAVAEMAFAGGHGASISISSVPLAESIDRDDIILFSESNSRFVVEVPVRQSAQFERRMSGVPCAQIGTVIDDDDLRILGLDGTPVVSAKLRELKAAWKQPLNW